MVELVCNNSSCGKNYNLSLSRYKANLKRGRKFYCSPNCANEGQRQRIQVTCFVCGISMLRLPKEVKSSGSGNFFCSTACLSQHQSNRQKGVAKKPLNVFNCAICSKPFSKPSSLGHRVHCDECFPIYQGKLDNRTKADSSRREVYGHAKKIMVNRPKHCQKCGYDKHVEICHIKPVAEFPLEALIKEINSPSNLIYFCPNCHWEFDNGLWGLSEVGSTGDWLRVIAS
jgi:hypothetical protein